MEDEVIGGVVLLVASLVMAIFAGINLRNCFTKGTASAYGHAYSRNESPAAFWVSAACSLVAVLLGLALAVVAGLGLIGVG